MSGIACREGAYKGADDAVEDDGGPLRGRVEAARCPRAVDISRAHRLEVDDEARDEDRCDSEGYKCSERARMRLKSSKTRTVLRRC